MTRRIQCQALDGSRLGCGVSARPSHRRREAISPHQGPTRAPRDLDGRRGARPERREEEREGRRGFSVLQARNSRGEFTVK